MALIQDYREIRPNLSVRSLLRSAAIRAAVVGRKLCGRFHGALLRPRVHFLYLHHVFRDEQTGFREILEYLAKSHEFVTYAEAVRRVTTGPVSRPCVAFSFDDGLKSCLRAAEILEQFGARACFFVCPRIVGETDSARIASFCRDRLELPPMEFLAWDDLEAMKRSGHEVGSHTLDHANLASVSNDEVHEQVARSREILQARLGETSHFSWPYGEFRHMSAGALAAILDAGYLSCASAVRGAHVVPEPDARRLCIRRDHVVAAWPLRHVQYFLVRSASAANRRDNQFPDVWPTARGE